MADDKSSRPASPKECDEPIVTFGPDGEAHVTPAAMREHEDEPDPSGSSVSEVAAQIKEAVVTGLTDVANRILPSNTPEKAEEVEGDKETPTKQLRSDPTDPYTRPALNAEENDENRMPSVLVSKTVDTIMTAGQTVAQAVGAVADKVNKFDEREGHKVAPHPEYGSYEVPGAAGLSDFDPVGPGLAEKMLTEDEQKAAEDKGEDKPET